MKWFSRLVWVMALCCVVPAAAHAELELELTIEGTPAEILAVLELLQQHGLAGTPDEATASAEEGLHFEIQSNMDSGAAPAEEAPPAEPPAPPPALRLENPAVTPAELAPGQQALITVTAVDEAHAIDTVSAKLFGTETVVDLFDNGANGDAAANDGQWTGLVQIPADAPPRSQRIDITGYDANGQVLTEDHGGGRSLTTRSRLQVTRPLEETPPAEAPVPEEASAAPASEPPAVPPAPAAPASDIPEAPPAPAPAAP
jgi:hypothetical protein